MRRFFSKKSIYSPKENLDSESAFLKGEISKVEGSEVILDPMQNVVLLPSENFQDPIIAFTKRVNETFICVEKHFKLSMDSRNDLSNPSDCHATEKESNAGKNENSTSDANSVGKSSFNNMKEVSFLITDQALYCLHPGYENISCKKSLKDEQGSSVQGTLQWFKEFYSKKWRPISTDETQIDGIEIKSETQTVLNDLFTSMYILPKWRMSFYYLDCICQENNYWILHYYSGDQKEKSNTNVSKVDVIRVSRRFKVQDIDKTLSWVETFKFSLRCYWMRKWEEMGVLESNERDSSKLTVGKDDIYQFHAWVFKINRKGQEQYRSLLFTTFNIYLVNTSPGEHHSSTPTIRWKTGILCLKEIRFYPEEPAVIGLAFDKNATKKYSKKIHSSYDFRCADEIARNKYAMEICRLYSKSSKGNSLSIIEKKGKPTGSNK